MASQRLQSLDILRGFTVAGMIMVNNGHSGMFGTLRHAAWNGLTLCDLVFPFFLFIMGVSLYLSFSGRGFVLTRPTAWKIVKRSLLLIIIGLAINWFDKAVGGNINCFSTLRYWAVLQRIALCYFIAAFTVLLVSRRAVLWISLCLLVVYGIIIIVGNGYDQDPSTNVISQADLWLFGYDHIYHKSAVDPEGLLGTLGSLVNVFLGFSCGAFVKNDKPVGEKICNVLLFGTLVLMAGYLLSFSFPFNKRIWSPSFALATSGWCALLLGVVMRGVDFGAASVVSPSGSVSNFFKVFGVNALFLYVFSEVLAVVCSETGLSDRWFGFLASAIPVAQLASLCYALSFVAFCFLAGYPLWKRRIYIKL